MEWRMKIKEFIKQVGYIRLILLLVCGIFLILVSLPEQNDGDGEKEFNNQVYSQGSSDDYDTDENNLYVEKMEERLAEILRVIEGAGRVEVMITLASSSETVVGKDQTYETDLENNGNGTERNSSLQKEETVFIEKDGDQNPYIIKTMEPVVEGIMIVMDGGNQPSVANAVTEAVQALFHVEAHKIKVLKMEDGS